MRPVIFFLLFLQAGLALAQTPITPAGAPIVVYQTSDDYDAIRSNLELAITGRGMLISSTLHISDMFNRTAADTGLANTFYAKAEAFEFCNLKLSWQMSAAIPPTCQSVRSRSASIPCRGNRMTYSSVIAVPRYWEKRKKRQQRNWH